MSDSRRWFVLAVAVLAAWLVYLLRPVLVPFAVSALLAYLADPLVDWLQTHRLPRTGAVCVVFVGIFVGALVIALLVLPALENQIGALVRRIPQHLEWIQGNLLPPVAQWLGLDVGAFGIEGFKRALLEHWSRAGGIAMALAADISRSGVALLGWLANLVLIPVVTFYLLRDWDVLVRKVHDLLPRSVEGPVGILAVQSDRVLGEFFRGQLLVMLALGTIYAAGLWLVGLEFALLIGIVAGVVSFVPYLGFIVGIVLALAAAFFQFHEAMPMVWVAVVFGIGQLLEGMVLTPLLVGDRIGLHPVAVIFSVLAGGQLFGFVGVLLALPAAAVIVVVLRYAHGWYVESDLYDDDPAVRPDS